MNDQMRMKRVDRAALKVLFHVPFFAAGVAKLPVSFTDDISTACTDGNKILWSRTFIDSLKDEQIVTVLAHEVCHCLLGHIWRAPVGCDWDVWNQAIDHATNLMLKEFGAQIQSKRMANPFPFPEPESAYCMNPAFAGMAEEKIYSILAGQNPPNGNKGKQGSGKGQGKPSAGQGQPQPGSMPSFGQISKPATSQEQQAKQKTDWQNTLLQSVAAQKQRGDVPGMLARIVQDLIEPAIEWQDLVRALLREQVNDDWNFMRPNKFFDESDFILPSLDSERIGALIVGIDTSGSIDQDILRQFKGIMQQALEELRPRKLIEICCDTRVTSEREYRVGETLAMDAPGGGGTRLEKIFERIEERDLAPKALVILTDLETTFPKQEPEYPVIWVTWGKTEAPFGTVISVN